MTFTPITATTTITEALLGNVNNGLAQSLYHAVASKSADFTAFSDDVDGSPRSVYLVTGGSGGVTVTLPTTTNAEVAAGRTVTVVKVDSGAGAVTLDPNGSETINGAATLALSSQYDRATIVSDGVSWYRID